VSQDAGLAVLAAVRCLQALQQLGYYVGYGRPTVGERPDTVEYTVEYLPTLAGLGYVRAQR
jgi:hypothetical protein